MLYLDGQRPRVREKKSAMLSTARLPFAGVIAAARHYYGDFDVKPSCHGCIGHTGQSNVAHSVGVTIFQLQQRMLISVRTRYYRTHAIGTNVAGGEGLKSGLSRIFGHWSRVLERMKQGGVSI